MSVGGDFTCGRKVQVGFDNSFLDGEEQEYRRDDWKGGIQKENQTNVTGIMQTRILLDREISSGATLT